LYRQDKSPVSERGEHHVKNDDEIDDSHKSQLDYTTKIKKNLNWAFEVFKGFFKKPKN